MKKKPIIKEGRKLWNVHTYKEQKYLPVKEQTAPTSSISELQEYCQTTHYIGCPFYEWIIKLKVKKVKHTP